MTDRESTGGGACRTEQQAAKVPFRGGRHCTTTPEQKHIIANDHVCKDGMPVQEETKTVSQLLLLRTQSPASKPAEKRTGSESKSSTSADDAICHAKFEKS